MGNVEQFRKEQEEHKQKIKDDQAKIRDQLSNQLQIQKKAKQEEMIKEQDFLQQLLDTANT